MATIASDWLENWKSLKIFFFIILIGWSSFKIVFDDLALQSRWPTKLLIENLLTILFFRTTG
jgi:hypothetical protein